MPAITRWFRVTHDINADPEIWELRETFGDRAILIWLECLSIGDRNKGVVGPNSEHTRNQLASKCRSSRVKVGLILDWCRVKGWLIADDYLRIAKWAKYNKVRDVDKPLSETTPILDNTDKTEDKNKREQPKPIELPDWLHAGAWESFTEHRRRIKKPLGPRAASLAITELDKLRYAGHDPALVIDQSVLNGWAGLFPIKPQVASVNGRAETPADRLSARIQRLTGGRGL